jgi:hypothetical protein
MNKNEAIMQLEEAKVIYHSETFCPLIKGKCNSECVCLNAGKAYEKSSGLWSVSDPHCMNRMFWG